VAVDEKTRANSSTDRIT